MTPLKWPRTLRIEVQPPLIGNEWTVTAITKRGPRLRPETDVYTRLTEEEALSLAITLSEHGV